jgi:hypothetical protein
MLFGHSEEMVPQSESPTCEVMAAPDLLATAEQARAAATGFSPVNAWKKWQMTRAWTVGAHAETMENR